MDQIFKLQPHRTMHLQGFDDYGASAALWGGARDGRSEQRLPYTRKLPASNTGNGQASVTGDLQGGTYGMTWVIEAGRRRSWPVARS